MFFKRKKKKLDENSNLVHCQSPECPTPKMTHPKENCFNMDGLILCQFCFTRKLSENPPENTINESKTKHIDTVELNRISPTQASWDIKNKSIAHLSRIGPSSENEKYMEELSMWKEIIKEIDIDQKYQQTRKITRLSQVQHTRIIETSGGILLISFVSDVEQKAKIGAENVLAKIFDKPLSETLSFEVKKLSKNIQDWINNNKFIDTSIDSLNNYFIHITFLESGVFAFEEIAEHLQNVEIEALLYELGRFFYCFNFIGYEYPFQILVDVKDETILFHITNFTFNKNSFSDMKTALQYLYLVFPTMLDDKYFQKFSEGASTEQKELDELLKRNETFKREVLQFFNSQNIKFDDKQELPSFDFNKEN